NTQEKSNKLENTNTQEKSNKLENTNTQEKSNKLEKSNTQENTNTLENDSTTIHMTDNNRNKIKQMKSLLGNSYSKKRTKVVLVFNDIKQLETLIKDMKEYEITINQSKLEDIQNKKVKKDRKEEIEIEDIPLGEKTLCILFNNLKILADKQSRRLQDVEITDLLVTTQNTDVFNKLIFKEKDGRLVDTTGYFTGRRISTTKVEDSARIFKTGLFHFKNLDKQNEENNTKNFRRIIKHLATLKKISVRDLFKEDCELGTVDRVIFHNNFDKNLEDFLRVCVCSDDICKNCSGNYKIEKGSLRY
ncbi:hypothetical protein NGRA_0888, partial [Nosema granulosis]